MTDNKRKKRGLGRGLSSLLDDGASDQSTGAAPGHLSISIDLLRPNPGQPRKAFPQAEMDDLIASIREKGVIQPLLVRPDPDRAEGYQIIAGERRWRAAQAAGLHEVPVLVREMPDEDALEIAIIENVQRSDLNAIEEALAYSQLIEQFGHNQAVLARTIGKSRPHIANTLRLLSLPDDVKDLLADGRISAGHARALITAADPSALAQRVVSDGLTVRQTEDLARKMASPAQTKKPRQETKDADTAALEGDLSAALSLKVAISHRGSKGGDLRISYRSLEELDSLCRLLMQ